MWSDLGGMKRGRARERSSKFLLSQYRAKVIKKKKKEKKVSLGVAILPLHLFSSTLNTTDILVYLREPKGRLWKDACGTHKFLRLIIGTHTL